MYGNVSGFKYGYFIDRREKSFFVLVTKSGNKIDVYIESIAFDKLIRLEKIGGSVLSPYFFKRPVAKRLWIDANAGHSVSLHYFGFFFGYRIRSSRFTRKFHVKSGQNF